MSDAERSASRGRSVFVSCLLSFPLDHRSIYILLFVNVSSPLDEVVSETFVNLQSLVKRDPNLDQMISLSLVVENPENPWTVQRQVYSGRIKFASTLSLFFFFALLADLLYWTWRCRKFSLSISRYPKVSHTRWYRRRCHKTVQNISRGCSCSYIYPLSHFQKKKNSFRFLKHSYYLLGLEWSWWTWEYQPIPISGSGR